MAQRQPDSDDTPDFGFLENADSDQPDRPATEPDMPAADSSMPEVREDQLNFEVPSDDASSHSPASPPVTSTDGSGTPKRRDAGGSPKRPQASGKKQLPQPEESSAAAGTSGSVPSWVRSYAVAVTLLLLGLLLTGRISLRPNHQLESLPDIRPLQQNEFQAVPEDAELPPGHALRLGETRRFGDVVVTPVRVTREPLELVDSFSGKSREAPTESPVLKLVLQFTNAADDIAFPVYGADLMSSRSPEFSTDEATRVNSALYLTLNESGGPDVRRVLNYLHPVDSSHDIAGQHPNRPLAPGATMESLVASSEDIRFVDLAEVSQCRWRIQIRKGVHRTTRNGVTTLIDVVFDPSEVSSESTDLPAG